MSEYQYFEFRALDRPLAPEEQEAVAGLSSRTAPHPTRASFVYHYTGFPADPLAILARYYDAFFYIANWGTTRLAFRLPASLVAVEALDPYLVAYHIEVEPAGEHLILQLTYEQERGYGWTEGEGRLGPLLGLRDELLRGDRRLLYLAWLSTLDRWDVDKTETEPPVPAGLQQLTAPQQAFVEEFHLDRHLLTAAAQASPSPATRREGELEEAIGALSPAQQRAWLLRLAGGEPNLDIAFRRALLGEQANTAGDRTVGELLKRARVVRRQQEREQAEAAEARRLQELEALAPQADEAWTRAQALVAEGTASGYDEGLKLLVKLHDLAIHQGTEAAFARKVHALREAYAGRYAALHRRLDEAGLP